jgi:DNA-directed RNA polymerase subunit RPC12/RpoP
MNQANPSMHLKRVVDESPQDATGARAFTAAPYPVLRRLGWSFGLSFLWVSINIWIPILGWALLLFTPLVFVLPLFMMKTARMGVCPYCDSQVQHLFAQKSFKCARCRQTVVVGPAEFRKIR